MIGVVVVRDGRVGPGAGDVARVADEVWLVDDGLAVVSTGPESVTRRIELGSFSPAGWAQWLAGEIGDACVVLAAEPDGRDLAARLAAELGGAVLAGCLAVDGDVAVVPRFGGATTALVPRDGARVLTVQVRGGEDDGVPITAAVERPALAAPRALVALGPEAPAGATADLGEADRIVAGGAGLASASDFGVLARVADALGGVAGASRVITDRGWVGEDRQIGTTGATVRPSLYIAFGISGAVQHTAGIGTPAHVISVNTDPACPMSLMADLVVVADAAATLGELCALAEAP